MTSVRPQCLRHPSASKKKSVRCGSVDPLRARQHADVRGLLDGDSEALMCPGSTRVDEREQNASVSVQTGGFLHSADIFMIWIPQCPNDRLRKTTSNSPDCVGAWPERHIYDAPNSECRMKV